MSEIRVIVVHEIKASESPQLTWHVGRITCKRRGTYEVTCQSQKMTTGECNLVISSEPAHGVAVSATAAIRFLDLL